MQRGRRAAKAALATAKVNFSKFSIFRLLVLFMLVGIPIFFIFIPYEQIDSVSRGFSLTAQEVFVPARNWIVSLEQNLVSSDERRRAGAAQEDVIKATRIQYENYLSDVKLRAGDGNVQAMYQLVLELDGFPEIVKWYRNAYMADTDKTKVLSCRGPYQKVVPEYAQAGDCRRMVNYKLLELIKDKALPGELVVESADHFRILAMLSFSDAEKRCELLGARLPDAAEFIKIKASIKPYNGEVIFAKDLDHSPMLCGNDYRNAKESEWVGEARRHDWFWVRNMVRAGNEESLAPQVIHLYRLLNSTLRDQMGRPAKHDRAQVVCVKKEFYDVSRHPKIEGVEATRLNYMATDLDKQLIEYAADWCASDGPDGGSICDPKLGRITKVENKKNIVYRIALRSQYNSRDDSCPAGYNKKKQCSKKASMRFFRWRDDQFSPGSADLGIIYKINDDRIENYSDKQDKFDILLGE